MDGEKIGEKEKEKGGSNWGKKEMDEDKKVCPTDDKKGCLLTITDLEGLILWGLFLFALNTDKTLIFSLYFANKITILLCFSGAVKWYKTLLQPWYRPLPNNIVVFEFAFWGEFLGRFKKALNLMFMRFCEVLRKLKIPKSWGWKSFLGKFSRFWEGFWETFGNTFYLQNRKGFLIMRKKNYKGRCTKISVSKSKEVCRTYDNIAFKYLKVLWQYPNKSRSQSSCSSVSVISHVPVTTGSK